MNTREEILVRFFSNPLFPRPERPATFPSTHPKSRDRTIDGLDLVETCTSCPEQYDVFDGDTVVGYIRLRGGFFYAAAPYCGGEYVLVEEFERHDGEFCDEETRGLYLTESVKRLKDWWQRKTR